MERAKSSEAEAPQLVERVEELQAVIERLQLDILEGAATALDVRTCTATRSQTCETGAAV